MSVRLVLLYLATHGFTTAAATKPAWYSEWTVVRGQAELPCLVPRPLDPSDKPLLALWYKETQPTVPIYSYDTRSGPFRDGVRWADKDHLGSRAFFRIISDPPTLVVEDVKVADQAVYTCRVDYKVRSSAITKVNLTVIVPPGPPIIFDAAGRPVDEGSVGPLREGEHTQLTCGSSGGSPTPTLTWWRDGERLHQVGRVGESGVESQIRVVASRTLQGATLTCQALNNNITEPAATSLTLDVLLKPLSADIVGGVGRLSAHVEVELVCHVVGSRPPARITWWRGGRNTTHVTHTVLNDGNVTTGSMTFVPTREDDGQTVKCSAVNPEIPDAVQEDSATLTVLYKPEVTLEFGRALDPRSIKEGDDVYFSCTVRANPPYLRISWFHNGELLESNRSAGLIISDTSLVLQKVKRVRAGVYTCASDNQEGRGTSNALTLNVMFAPVCSSPGRKTLGVARTESAQVVCQVHAFPPQVNFTWRFNGSSEGESLPLHAIRSQGTSSHLNYTASREQDYGTLLCWATNAIGTQKEPCIIHLIPAGPPDPPRNCSITNQTSEALVVACWPGPDGGLPQHFVMEAWHDGVLLSNTSSLAPEFVVRGLEPGMGVTLKVRATNTRGQSSSVTLDADVMKVAEKRMGPPDDGGVLVPPVVGGVVGGVAGVLVLVVAGLFLAHYAHHSRPHALPSASKERSPPTLTNVYVSGGEDDVSHDSHSGNPDVIKGTGEDSGVEEVASGGGSGRRRVEAVAVLQGSAVSGVTTTLPQQVKMEGEEREAGSDGPPPTNGRGDTELPSLYPGHIPPPYLAHISSQPPAPHFSHLTHTSHHHAHPSAHHHAHQVTGHPPPACHGPYASTHRSHSDHMSRSTHSIHHHPAMHTSTSTPTAHLPHPPPAPQPHPPFPTSHIHQGVLDPGDLGPHVPHQYCMRTTASLHDLAGSSGSAAYTRAQAHQYDSSVPLEEGVSVYGTLRRGERGGREAGVGAPHPKAVGAFLATSHQESAV